MDVRNLLIWAIPLKQDPSKFLAEKLYYQIYQFGDNSDTHKEFCEKFIEEHHLNHKGRGNSHLDYALTFVENDLLLGCNSGVKVNGKYYCSLFLPENLSAYQINYLMSQKEIFAKHFFKEENMFSTLIYTPNPLTYNSGYPNFRNLKIEAIINRNSNYLDGQALLYEYLINLEEKIKKR